MRPAAARPAWSGRAPARLGEGTMKEAVEGVEGVGAVAAVAAAAVVAAAVAAVAAEVVMILVACLAVVLDPDPGPSPALLGLGPRCAPGPASTPCTRASSGWWWRRSTGRCPRGAGSRGTAAVAAVAACSSRMVKVPTPPPSTGATNPSPSD